MVCHEREGRPVTGRAAESGTSWSGDRLLSSTLISATLFPLVKTQRTVVPERSAGFSSVANTRLTN